MFIFVQSLLKRHLCISHLSRSHLTGSSISWPHFKIKTEKKTLEMNNCKFFCNNLLFDIKYPEHWTLQFCWAKYCSIWKFLLKVGFVFYKGCIWIISFLPQCFYFATLDIGRVSPSCPGHNWARHHSLANIPLCDRPHPGPSSPFALPPKSTPFYFSKSSIFQISRFSIFFFHFKYSHLPPRAALSGRITNWTQTLIALIVVQVPAAIST